MTALTDLERLALEATPSPWFNTSEDDRPTGSVGTNPLTNDVILTWADKTAKADAAYIAACSPQTVLALIEVARAAKALIDYEREGAPAKPSDIGWPDWDARFDALRSALAALASDSGEGRDG